MTDERDFDRLARAWLGLGPNEAPDRVVAAVLRAAETTPQVRRPFRSHLWRSFAMNRFAQAVGAVAVLAIVVIGGALLLNQRQQPPVAGPATPLPVTPSPSPVASPSATVQQIVLQYLTIDGQPVHVGGPCETMAVEWTSATIRIDPESNVKLEVLTWLPGASEPTMVPTAVDVWAEANTGARLKVFWTAGFSATDGDRPVVRGLRGEEVARDGTDAGDLSRVAGYFVCGGPDALYVSELDPSKSNPG